jgi:hypothetical protein
MFWIALKIMIANSGKYLMMIGSAAFASLLICWQTAIICSVIALTYSQIRNVREAENWVMDLNVLFVKVLCDVLMRATTLGKQDDLNTIAELAVGGGTKELLEPLALGQRQGDTDHLLVRRRMP